MLGRCDVPGWVVVAGPWVTQPTLRRFSSERMTRRKSVAGMSPRDRTPKNDRTRLSSMPASMASLWICACCAFVTEAFPGNGKQKAQDAEMARLRKGVAKLKMERDILKKAAAYFAKESM